MKKVMMMVCALVMSAAMHAATALVLDINDAQVTYYSSDYYSQEDAYCYHFVLQHKATNPADEFPMLEFTIYQTTNKGLVSGHYTKDDNNLTEVVLTRDLYDAIAQELGGYTWQAAMAELDVVANKDGSTSLKMRIEDVDGVDYSLELTQKITVVESKKHPYNDPYLVENQTPQERKVTMDSILWDDTQFYTDNTMRLELLSTERDKEGHFYRAVLWVNTLSQLPAAGTYPIEGTAEPGTVDASYGYDSINYILYPTYFGLSDDRGLMYDPEVYFLVMGEVVISYPENGKIRIAIDATSYWKSHITCVYEGKIGYEVPETETYDVELGEDVDLKNKGYLGIYEYSLQMAGSDAKGNRYVVTLDVTPTQEQVAGHFTKAAGTFNTASSAVVVNKGEAVRMADGDFTITLAKDGSYQLSGWVRDARGNLYNLKAEKLNIEFVSEEEYRYDLEARESTKHDIVFSDIIWDQSTVEHSQYLTIVLVNNKANSAGLKDEAVFWMATPTAVFPAGEYPINSSAKNFTFYASPGDDGTGVSPCLYYTVSDKGIQEVWFLVGGSVKIDYPTESTISIEVHAVSYFGSEINLYYNVPGMGVEEVVSDSAARKVVRDGELRIEMNGVEYNVLGTRL